ncbi:MAG: hypothetical protein KatS3mg111_3772 [Pirellulaceae bacterium]|nr:MAG: hypothetical protein KatS3mg111_3772 [Pirellulaceae bacterium]
MGTKHEQKQRKESTIEARANRRIRRKLLLIALVVIAMLVSYWQFADTLSMQSLAAREAELRAWQREHPWVAYGVAFAAYVLITGLSLPGATVLTLACGWFFGWVRGVVLVSFASTTGATVAFLVSRYLLRDTIVHRFGDRLKDFDRALEREGPYYLLMLRLIPAVPFFVINVVMGLTPMRVRTFWWVSQLGMLPGTIVYVYAGAAVPDLHTLASKGVEGILSPRLMFAFALLGLMPLLLRKVADRWGPRRAAAAIESK